MTKPFSVGDERFYKSPYGDVPGVTTILAQLAKPGLIPWAAGKAVDRMRPYLELIKSEMIAAANIDIDDILAKAKKEHKEAKEEGGDLGSKMHDFIANYYRMIRNGARRDESYSTVGAVVSGLGDPRANKAWGAFFNWDLEHTPFPILIEHQVVSHYKYGGTLDFFGILDGKNTVVDFKAANAIYPETVMQTAAYGFALMEMASSAEDVNGWGCLRLDRETGDPEYVSYEQDEIEYAFQRFLKLTEYWHLTNDWRQKARAKKKEAKAESKRLKLISDTKETVK
jgi:hypothetical protein